MSLMVDGCNTAQMHDAPAQNPANQARRTGRNVICMIYRCAALPLLTENLGRCHDFSDIAPERVELLSSHCPMIPHRLKENEFLLGRISLESLFELDSVLLLLLLCLGTRLPVEPMMQAQQARKYHPNASALPAHMTQYPSQRSLPSELQIKSTSEKMNQPPPIRQIHAEIITRPPHLFQRLFRLVFPYKSLRLAGFPECGSDLVREVFRDRDDLYVRMPSSARQAAHFPRDGHGTVCCVEGCEA